MLSIVDMKIEPTEPLYASTDSSSIWCLTSNPTPTNMSDKSGKGYNPAWVGSQRPSLYTASAAPPPSPPTNLRIMFLIGCAVYRARIRPRVNGDDDDLLT